jgi:hypothetical protein
LLFLIVLASLCMAMVHCKVPQQKQFRSARVADAFRVEKFNLNQDTIVSSVCSDDFRVYTFNTSDVISVCNLDCADFQFSYVQLNDTLTLISDVFRTIDASPSLVGVTVTPLDNYTSTYSSVLPVCQSFSQDPITFYWSISCTLLDDSFNNSLIQCASDPMMAHHSPKVSGNIINKLSVDGREDPFEHLSLIKSMLGRKKLTPSVFVPPKTHSEQSFGSSQCTTTATSTCLSYRVDIQYQVTFNPSAYQECPVITVVNDVQANSSRCVCFEEQIATKYGKENFDFGQCGSNVTYCSTASSTGITANITNSADFNSSDVYTLNCVVQPDCGDCFGISPNPAPGCQFSQVVCTATFNNLGTSPLDIPSVLFSGLDGTTGVTLVSVTSATCPDSIIGYPSVTDCCLAGLTNQTIVATYCIQKNDSATPYTFSEYIVSADSCNNSVLITTNLTDTSIVVDAQNVCVQITKESLDGTNYLCPDSAFNSSSVLCHNYRVNVTIGCGCLTTFTTFLYDNLTAPNSIPSTINVTGSSGPLTCDFDATTSLLICNLTSPVSAGTVLNVTYQVCLTDCTLCIKEPLVKIIDLPNTATVVYDVGVNNITASASLLSEIVCACPSCLCTSTTPGSIEAGFNKTGLFINPTGESHDDHYYFTGSSCVVTRTNTSVVLGTFYYGVQGEKLWYCLTPPENDTSSPCHCKSDSVPIPTPPLFLVCEDPENVTVTCCYLNNLFPDGPISGGVVVHSCLGAEAGTPTCLGDVLSFTGPDPGFSGGSAPLKKRKDFSCSLSNTYYDISFGNGISGSAFTIQPTLNGVLTVTSWSVLWLNTTKPPTFNGTYLVLQSGDGVGWNIGDTSDPLSVSSPLLQVGDTTKTLVIRAYLAKPDIPGSTSGNVVTASLGVTMTHGSSPPLTLFFSGSNTCT